MGLARDRLGRWWVVGWRHCLLGAGLLRPRIRNRGCIRPRVCERLAALQRQGGFRVRSTQQGMGKLQELQHQGWIAADPGDQLGQGKTAGQLQT